ncbi:MAG: HAD family hydrolase [Selenomonadaceae bacterium]|nr:HAD family hydrolase [Selenomonadaceae bacterium]
MKLNISDYKAYIVDCDGTLYFQHGVRMSMMLCMLKYFLTHFWRLKDLFIIFCYRRIRERRQYAAAANIEAMEYAAAALKCRTTPDYVATVIKRWMIERPCQYLKAAQDEALLSFLREQQRQGKPVIVYSDYPLSDKLAALDFAPSASYYTGDAVINCLKPDNQGLEYILSTLRQKNIHRNEVLFIGDRDDRDGLCARESGVDCLILKKFKGEREGQWRKLMQN